MPDNTPLSITDINNSIKIIDRLIHEKKTQDAMDLLQYLSSNSIPDALGRLGRLYRDGALVSKDWVRSAEYYSKATQLDDKWVYEYIDLLYRVADENSLSEAYNMAKTHCDNHNAMGRLGRMYRDGKGTEQDLKLSIGWYKKACDINDIWASEYIDVLLRCNTSEYDKIALDCCRKNISAGSDKIYARMGKMYKLGRGVGKDIEQSIVWYEAAYKKNGIWKNEYVDSLLKSNIPSHVGAGVELCERWANEGDADSMGRLSQLFHRGILNDRKKGLLWAEKAYSLDKKWIYNYVAQLFDSNEHASHQKAIDICEANRTDNSLCKMIAKHYCSKYIDDESHAIAKKWYEGIDYTTKNDGALDYADLLMSSDDPESINKGFYVLLNQSLLGNNKVDVRLTSLKPYATNEYHIIELYSFLHGRVSSIDSELFEQYFTDEHYKNNENRNLKKRFGFKPIVETSAESALDSYLELIKDRGTKSDLKSYVDIQLVMLRKGICLPNTMSNLVEYATLHNDPNLFEQMYGINRDVLSVPASLLFANESNYRRYEEYANERISSSDWSGYAYLGYINKNNNPRSSIAYFEKVKKKDEWVLSNLFQLYVDNSEYDKALSLVNPDSVVSDSLLLQYYDLLLHINPDDRSTLVKISEKSKTSLPMWLYLYEFLSHKSKVDMIMPEGLDGETGDKDSLLLYHIANNNLHSVLSLFPLTNYRVYHTGMDYLTEPLFAPVNRFYCESTNNKKILVDSKKSIPSVEPNQLVSIICGKIKTGITGFKKAINCSFGTLNEDRLFRVFVPHRAHGLILSAINYFERIDNEFEANNAIDLTNFPNSCTPILELGLYNVWGYFFKTHSTPLREIYNSKNVEMRENDLNANLSNDEKLVSFRNNFRLSRNMETLLNQKYVEIYDKKKGVLGVIYRGTDHLFAKGLNHPIPFEYPELIETVKSIVEKYEYDWIYLNTEDRDAYDLMKKTFGNKIIALDQERYSNTGDKLIAHMMMESDIPLKSLEDARNYLMTVLLTSKADAFLTSHCFGAEAVKMICNPEAAWFPEMMKGRWHTNGGRPLKLVSTNKNIVKFKDRPDKGVRLLGSSTISLMGAETTKKIIFNTERTKLLSSREYTLSVIMEGVNGTLTLNMYNNNDLIKTIMITSSNHCCFVLSEPVNAYSIEMALFDVRCDNHISLQLEEGTQPSSFINHYECITELAIKDRLGNIHEGSTNVNLDEGWFIENDVKYLLDTNELRKWRNIVKFDGGIQYYLLE